MKRLLIICAMAFTALSSSAVNLSGKWVTTTQMTNYEGESIDVTYTFTNDSLYIDVYPSGCPFTCMKLEQVNNIYIATETTYSTENPDKIMYIKIYHLEFLPCVWDKKCLAVYRDGIITDIIRKIP